MSGLKALLVEDSDVSAAIITMMIERVPGWRVVGRTGDAREAEGMIGRLAPDVITLDLHIAGGNGFETLGRLVDRTGIPIVVVSTSVYEGSPVTAEVLARGADSCFDKARLMRDAEGFTRTLESACRRMH